MEDRYYLMAVGRETELSRRVRDLGSDLTVFFAYYFCLFLMPTQSFFCIYVTMESG